MASVDRFRGAVNVCLTGINVHGSLKGRDYIFVVTEPNYSKYRRRVCRYIFLHEGGKY